MDLELVSQKYASTPDELTDAELAAWVIYLKDRGFLPNAEYDISDFFNLDNEFGTNELRVRDWIWIDNENREHLLKEMNFFPGDTEEGYIWIDGKFQLEIGNSEEGEFSLTWRGPALPGFDEKLFEKIRVYLADGVEELEEELEEMESDEEGEKELLERVVTYLQSDLGQDAQSLDQEVTEAFHQRVNN